MAGGIPRCRDASASTTARSSSGASARGALNTPARSSVTIPPASRSATDGVSAGGVRPACSSAGRPRPNVSHAASTSSAAADAIAATTRGVDARHRCANRQCAPATASVCL